MACVCARHTYWALSSQALFRFAGCRVVQGDLVNNGTHREERGKEAEQHKEGKDRERGERMHKASALTNV